jgi:hypothetical protein
MPLMFGMPVYMLLMWLIPLFLLTLIILGIVWLFKAISVQNEEKTSHADPVK